jgi:acetylornithine deacetylase/succinyl-diaminopimelate desuccinylase-like protein
MRAFVLLAALLTAQPALAADPGEARFRAIYRDIVAINTVHGEGSCTRAAAAAATHLRQAGFSNSDLFSFAPENHGDEGGLVAVLRGSDAGRGAILLLGHLDTVPARREDWNRDPFVLAEENGYFIARGAQDMKGLIAIWIDALATLRKGAPPQRTVRLALTCGEEGAGINGLRWLIANRPDLLKADFALNEGGGGRLAPDGAPQSLAFQVLEKTYADFQLVAIDAGGHSSVPRPDNAIVALGDAIKRIASAPFPARVSDTTRAFFRESANSASPPYDAAMRRIAVSPEDVSALSVLARDPQYNAMLRTTCVATRIAGGHANNALPQRATAIVNCRILPGETVAGTLAELKAAIGEIAVEVAPVEGGTQAAIAQPLPEPLVRIARGVASLIFPGVPVIPTMSVAASDSPALIAAGIPTYGVPGIMTDSDGGNMHGRNERVRVKALMGGRRYILELLKRVLDAR